MDEREVAFQLLVDEYLDAVRRSLEIQAPQAMIMKLPLEAKPERLELGMSW